MNQTLAPTEVVLVKDGPLTDALETVIARYTSRYPSLKIVPLQKNMGLGYALREGLKHCTCEYVARMDSDDINVKERFEKQVHFLDTHPSISIVGTGICEFKNIPGDTATVKSLPADNELLKVYGRKRNPFNHSTVMFRKFYILDVGSYVTMPLFEDYYLWLRLIKKQYNIANIHEPLLYFRIGNDVIGRRIGISYLKKELFFLRISYKEGLLSLPDYIRSVITRAPFRLLPRFALYFVYKNLLRK